MAEQQGWLETLVAACDAIVDSDGTVEEIRVAAVDLRERLLVDLEEDRAVSGAEG